MCSNLLGVRLESENQARRLNLVVPFQSMSINSPTYKVLFANKVKQEYAGTVNTTPSDAMALYYGGEQI